MSQEYAVFTKEQFENGVTEMASNMFHGGFMTRRTIGPPVENMKIVAADAMVLVPCEWDEDVAW